MEKTVTKRQRTRDCGRLLVLLDMLRGRHDHPDATTCYRDMRKLIPNIGQSTVYRHLAALVKDGLVNELRLDDGPARYDADTHDHAHFICASCHKLWDVSPIRVQATFPGTVETVTYLAYGICSSCEPIQSKDQLNPNRKF
jgi:Fur family peroxide stress response transcriptional regulator